MLYTVKTAQWQGLKGVNFKFAKGMTYKFSFDLTVSKMGSTDYFEVLFADGTAEKVSHGLATYVKVGETVKVEFYVTLLADATEFLIGCWDGGAEYTIDNFVIENTVEPTEPEEPEIPDEPIEPDVPDEPENPSVNCSCKCHKNGFMGFIWKILRIFFKLFGSQPVCSCGVAHY